MKRRVFNYRPLSMVALFLAVGLLVGECLYGFNTLFRLIPIVLSISIGIGLFIFKRTRRFTYFAVTFLIGVLAMCGANDVYDSRRIDGGYASIQATVDSEIVAENDSIAFYAKDIVLDGESLRGRTYVKVNDVTVPDFRAGDVVVIYGNIEFKEHLRFDSYYAVAVNKKAYYNMWGKSVYKVADGKPSFPLNLQLNIKQMFYENLDGETAMICQALVLGDKFGIDDDLYDGIKDSGLAHVLAVSGLHVTAFASAILYLLKKTKIKPIISFILVAAVTFFYVLMCGFTASSLRAFIMTLVLNFGVCMGYKYDKMSSLSLAGVVLMLVRPQTIMDVGFLLSMFSVLGIFMFYSTFKTPYLKLRDKVNLVDKSKDKGNVVVFISKAIDKGATKVADITAVSLSANIMTYPFVGHFFGSFPILFVASNVLILPYLMFIYIILLIITVFCQLTTLWGGVGIMQILLVPLRAWCNFVGSLEWSTVNISVSLTMILAWVVSAIAASKYVFMKRRIRFIFIALWLALFTAFVTIGLI